MSRDLSEQAFPFAMANRFNRGMSMRDYFAGQVICMLAEKEIDSTFGKGEPGTPRLGRDGIPNGLPVS